VHEVVVGQRVRGGPRITVETVALVPGDMKIIATDWLPDAPEYEQERAELDVARAELQAAWSSLRGLNAELVDDARGRVLGQDRPRLDPEMERTARQEAVVRAEIQLVHVADAVVQRLRERLPAGLQDDRAAATSASERAARLRAEAEQADAEARVLAATVAWKQRTISGPLLRHSDAVARATVRHELPPGIMRMPTMTSSEPGGR
jgi:hypothetical protein